MSVEVLLLVNLGGITLLAYMVAINAHGPTRLGISYLLATCLLAASVWVVVQHVNVDFDNRKTEEIRRLDQEKRQAHEQIRTQEEELREKRSRIAITARINALVATGTALVVAMQNADLHDRSTDLDGLIARAVARGKESRQLREEFEKIKTDDDAFDPVLTHLGEAIQLAGEAAYYHRSFYYSEDVDQEGLRERIMRQKARASREKFEAALAGLSD